MKTVLITGGSRGIGRATAVQLARLGMRVLINYKSDHQAAKEVIAQIQAFGGLAYALACDISSENEVVKLFETIK